MARFFPSLSELIMNFGRIGQPLGLVGIAALLITSSSATALADDAQAAKVPQNSLHVRSALGIRPIPLGAKLELDAGYRMILSDSDALLLKGTYLEAGVTTTNSPSNFWGGAYVEALPLAVLKIRLAARSMSHFGTFGYLYLPDDLQDPDWSLDAIKGPISSGHAANGYMLDAQVTLQAKVKNFVVLVPGQYSYVKMNVDQDYYETNIDFLLAPEEQVWTVQPTLGYVFVFEESRSWLLTGLRWEHSQTVKTDLGRDMPQALGMWKLPGDLAGGEMQLVGLGGYWLKHPNRQGTPYFATQFSVDWHF